MPSMPPTPQGSPGLTLLYGVRVVDFTQAMSGPFCTLMLADLGARVAKIEDPRRGDDARHWDPRSSVRTPPTSCRSTATSTASRWT